ncbi:hypothetical protein [Paludisphaera mucosa]|uniref:Transporter n=1 Tax=Paludisphaera mucosa TaxID=3030827 RepID=A0ABT6FHR3_9BACT|nr:hypothetical protein [Paludisphaera mucosa]MDG3007107.1 hypothetical protein [Paludisphaera mucosa]
MVALTDFEFPGLRPPILGRADRRRASKSALCLVLLAVGLTGCATTAPPGSVRLQSPAPESTDDRAAASTPAVPEPSMGDVSSTLRHRLEDSVGAGEDPEFHYPDVHTDPAETYRDRYGVVEEDHDPFILPWLANLIFEDRWLLADKDPDTALKNQLDRRMKVDIRDPAPDTANFPNSPYTLAKGRAYLETSPLGLYGASRNGTEPRLYQWEHLFRYGLTDNLEFRIFSNGLTSQAALGRQPATAGYSPLAFDFKVNLWEENTRYHLPAMGVEMYIQTTFGSPAFNSGTQPSLNLLFDQSLPFGIGLEYNFGMSGVQNGQDQIVYQFSCQWSLQRELFKDFDVFFHGFYNASALPRLLQFQNDSTADVPNVTVLGVGGIRTINDRLAIFGSYNMGVTPESPKTLALMGFAVGF